MGCIQLESEIISLLFFQQHDALPVIVAVPEEKQKEDFLLAYSCMPAALTDIAKIKDKKVVLFTKARERNLPAHRPLRTASLPSPRTPSAGGREVDRVLQAVPEHRDQKGRSPPTSPPPTALLATTTTTPPALLAPCLPPHHAPHHHVRRRPCPLRTASQVGGEFADYLSRCSGLVASPSPGVVTQALAVGTPCYLICPAGHLEQSFNEVR